MEKAGAGDFMAETIEDLGRDSFRIIQPARGFRFGMDSVLLADFARVKPGERVADICAGAGAISLLLAAREASCSIDAVEIDAYYANLARRNAQLNGISDRMSVLSGDIRDCYKTLGCGKRSLVVCNPPYFEGEGRKEKHLGELTLCDIARAANRLLPPGGRACFVYPAAGFLELASALKSNRLEPKRCRCVCHSQTRAPKLMLVESKKDARPGLTWLPALFTGADSPEMRAIYNS